MPDLALEKNIERSATNQKALFRLNAKKIATSNWVWRCVAENSNYFPPVANVAFLRWSELAVFCLLSWHLNHERVTASFKTFSKTSQINSISNFSDLNFKPKTNSSRTTVTFLVNFWDVLPKRVQISFFHETLKCAKSKRLSQTFYSYLNTFMWSTTSCIMLGL